MNFFSVLLLAWSSFFFRTGVPTVMPAHSLTETRMAAQAPPIDPGQPGGPQKTRVSEAGAALTQILNGRDAIPTEILNRAYCVVVMPSVVKLALTIGDSGVRGVMTCRSGRNFDSGWGPPVMMALDGGSAGLQIGGVATDFVLLLMSDRSVKGILSSKVKMGTDASAAAGPVGRSASDVSAGTLRAEILSYTRARGAFAGVSLEGSTLRPDNDGNTKLYGREIKAEAIVFDNIVNSPPSADLLLRALDSKSPRLRR